MDRKIKHLEMIQGIITRMSSNLFILKGWSVTLIVALFTVVAKDFKGAYIVFAFCILFIFWILDGYFLSLERRYRELYNSVRIKENDKIDFSMSTSDYNVGRNTWIRSIFATTLSIFYGVLLTSMIIVIVMSNIENIKFSLVVNWFNTNGIATTTEMIRNVPKK